MSKLYEILGVRQGVVGKCREALADLVKTFTSKKDKFGKKISTAKFLDQTKPDEITYQFSLETTVPAELAWLTRQYKELFDISYQVSATNQRANADLILDGTIILKNVPATALLEMENYVMELKEGFKTIPTLDGASDFKRDSNERFGVYKARDVMKTKTGMTKEVITRSPATDKFPAQTEIWDRQVVVANVCDSEWSGFITVADKAALLDRCEEFLKAIKKAQSRANAADLVGEEEKPGATILNHLVGPLLEKQL